MDTDSCKVSKDLSTIVYPPPFICKFNDKSFVELGLLVYFSKKIEHAQVLPIWVAMFTNGLF